MAAGIEMTSDGRGLSRDKNPNEPYQKVMNIDLFPLVCVLCVAAAKLPFIKLLRVQCLAQEQLSRADVWGSDLNQTDHWVKIFHPAADPDEQGLIAAPRGNTQLFGFWVIWL